MKTIKKSNSILKKGLLVFLSFVTLPVFINGQVKVGITPSNGDVVVGDVNATTPTRVFNVLGTAFISHNLRTTDPNYQPGMTGVYFQIYNNGISDYPIMQPQWGNFYYLGNPQSYFKELHIRDGWLHNGGSVSITSDKRLKENIKPLSSTLDKILNIKSYTYDMIYKNDPEVPNHVNEDGRKSGKNKTGFMAQDIMADFPGLVKYNEKHDLYGVDYTGFVPFLVKAMQEQNDIITQLRSEIEVLKQNSKAESSGSFGTTNESDSEFKLVSSKPVSIKSNVTISYSIPLNTVNAFMVIYDLNGKQLLKLSNLETGSKTVELPVNSLEPGAYLYTLIANGEEVDTKKIILMD
jgi:hypothetical protein